MRLYFTIIGIMLFSCGENKEFYFLNDAIKISGKEMILDSLIGKPSEVIYKGGLVLYTDPVNGMSMGVVDAKKEMFLERIFPIGRGPNELIFPFKLDCTDDQEAFNVFQFNTGKLLKIAVQPDNLFTIEEDVLFENHPANVKQVPNGFVGIGPYKDGRVMRYNEEGKELGIVADYPLGSSQSGLNNIQKFLAYQAQIFTHRDKLVVASSYSDNLEFYALDSANVRLLNKYGTYDVDYQLVNEQFKLTDNSMMSYKWVYGTDKYCYLLYSGKTFAENQHRVAGGRYILVFDWEGNFIKSFETEQYTYSFCVNDENNAIYAFGLSNGEMSLIVYSI